MSRGEGVEALSATDLLRRLANLVRIGVVESVDGAKARVTSGDLHTDGLSWLPTRAGKGRSWWAPSVGEQVVVLSPNGDLAQGLIIGSLFSDDEPPPSTDHNVHRVEYDDGTYFEYDSGSSTAKLHCVGSVVVEADGDVSVSCASLSAVAQGAAEVNCASLSATVTGDATITAVNLTATCAGAVAITGATTVAITSTATVAVTGGGPITLTAPQVIIAGQLVPTMGMAPPTGPGIPDQIEVTTAKFIIHGDLVVDGSIEAGGAVSADGEVTGNGIELSTHKHGGVTIGGGQTGGPS